MTGKCGVNRARGRMTITKIMTIKKKIKKKIKMVIRKKIKMMTTVIMVDFFSSIFHSSK